MTNYEPKDNKELREQYEPDGGVCGPACIAVMQHMTVAEVIEKWPVPYPGHSQVRHLKEAARRCGLKLKQRGAGKSDDVPADYAIARVQWLGPHQSEWHGWTSFWEATCNTHFIVMQGKKVWCNSDGWFDRSRLPKYLEDGYITSYMEVEGI